jgi:septum formation protein
LEKAPSKMWLESNKLVLASRSKARAAMLMNAGVPIDIVPADIDERGLEEKLHGFNPAAVALFLAEAKAAHVSEKTPDRLVLGSDQTLELNGAAVAKAGNLSEAKKRLQELSGRKHALHSAYCFARDGIVLRSGVKSAELTMRQLSDAFIDAYLDLTGPAVLDCVGVYEIEGAGITLFEAIHGEWFTILGLPLKEVIDFLQNEGFLLK